MFITTDINAATIAYFKKSVLRKLLMSFSFEPQSNNKAITDLFKSINHYGFDLSNEYELDLFVMLMQFKNNLEEDELTALYFWGLNQKYMYYFENFLGESDSYPEKKFDKEFGRSLGLEEDTIEELKVLLCNFASEFDLSVIDEFTSEEIVEVIDIYCSSSNNFVPVL